MLGTDAFAYINFIPTGLFVLHLVVADQDVQQASTEIMESLPYKLCTSILHYSVHLELTSPHDKRNIDDPEMIIIHPQLQLYLDVHDKSRSVSLPPFPDTIRFPSRTAFIDSMLLDWSSTYQDEGYALKVDVVFSSLHFAESSTSTPKRRSRTRTCEIVTESLARKSVVL